MIFLFCWSGESKLIETKDGGRPIPFYFFPTSSARAFTCTRYAWVVEKHRWRPWLAGGCCFCRDQHKLTSSASPFLLFFAFWRRFKDEYVLCFYELISCLAIQCVGKNLWKCRKNCLRLSYRFWTHGLIIWTYVKRRPVNALPKVVDFLRACTPVSSQRESWQDGLR